MKIVKDKLSHIMYRRITAKMKIKSNNWILIISLVLLAPNLLISQQSKWKMNFVSTKIGEGNKLMMLGEGETLLSRSGIDYVAHSGNIIEIDSNKIVLQFNDKDHSFQINSNTKLCLDGNGYGSLNDFKNKKEATVITDRNNELSLEIYDRLMGFYATTSGTIPVEFKCNPTVTNKKSDLIKDVQSLLNKLGYDAGKADGLMGRRTRNAIRKFEKDFGFNLTGQVSAALLNHLKDADLKQGK